MPRKNKLNPRKKVLTEADTKRAMRELEAVREDIIRQADEFDKQRAEIMHKATMDAIYSTYAIVFRWLKDKRGWKTESLKRLQTGTDTISRSVTSGEITLQDIFQSLKDEDEIVFEGIQYKEG